MPNVRSIRSYGGGRGGSAPSSSPVASSSSAVERMDDVQVPRTVEEIIELEYRRAIVPKLARRAYHLEEGSGWWDDWVQYQRNTHPVFGLCLYHRLHPVRWRQRIVILIGSIGEWFFFCNL